MGSETKAEVSHYTMELKDRKILCGRQPSSCAGLPRIFVLGGSAIEAQAQTKSAARCLWRTLGTFNLGHLVLSSSRTTLVFRHVTN